MSLLSKKTQNFYLSLLLFFIFGDIICDNYVIKTLNTQIGSLEIYLFLGFLTLQIIASPLQAGFSDFYCRRISLIVSLSLSLFSLILALVYNLTMLYHLPILIMILLSKSLFGNTIPLCWAAVADIKQKNLRLSLALSTAAYALGYLIIAFFNSYFTLIQSHIWALAIFVVAVYVSIQWLQDIRDKRNNHIKSFSPTEHSSYSLLKKECISLVHHLNSKNLVFGLIAFTLWETSLYSILILLVDFQDNYSAMIISMMCGYLLGVLIMKFCSKISDESMIQYGYYISILALVSFFIGLVLFKTTLFILPTCYFFYSMGNAFLSPSMLSVLSKTKPIHERGKVFGFIESSDTLGFLLASIIILLHKKLHLELPHMVAFSLMTFLISWIPYSYFLKTKRLLH